MQGVQQRTIHEHTYRIFPWSIQSIPVDRSISLDDPLTPRETNGGLPVSCSWASSSLEQGWKMSWPVWRWNARAPNDHTSSAPVQANTLRCSEARTVSGAACRIKDGCGRASAPACDQYLALFAAPSLLHYLLQNVQLQLCIKQLLTKACILYYNI